MKDGFADITNEIVLYQPNEEIKLEVRMDEETVWLTQSQIAYLFGCSSDNVGLHLKNIFSENELDKNATAEFFSVVQKEGNRNVRRNILHYNLDAILSVGYRVSSLNATKFRQWANKVLKDHLLKGYSFNQRIERLEQRVSVTENKIDFFVKTALPTIRKNNCISIVNLRLLSVIPLAGFITSLYSFGETKLMGKIMNGNIGCAIQAIASLCNEGGRTIAENCQMLCRKCNRRKSGK